MKTKVTNVGLKAGDVCSAVVLVVTSLRLLLDTETDQLHCFNTAPSKHFSTSAACENMDIYIE